MSTITTLDKPQVQESAQTVKQIWRDEVFPCPTWQRGAFDAYYGRRPEFASAQYMKGYCQQLQELPVDESGNIEWFRYRVNGGWKLTDNI